MKNFLLVLSLMFFAGTSFAQTATPPSAGDGSSGNPYQIATLNNLYWVTQTSSSWSSCFIQTSDIDASGSSSWDGGAGFTPIGSSFTRCFTGSYDGQGYKITGLFINRLMTDYYVGLFGSVNGGTIKNVKLDNVHISGYTDVGGLMGCQHDSSTVTNCCISGSVTGVHYVGGLIGWQNRSAATNCHSNDSVTGSYIGDYVGGLIGMQDTSCAITNCYSNGSVTGNSEVGGLVGAQGTSCAITNCYSNGSVTGGIWVGGLVGAQWYSTAANCYSTDSVTGTEVGGLIGDQISSTATNCYSSGSVTGTGGNIGGLIAYENNSAATNCFWDTQTSGQTSSAGGTGKSTAAMKSYFTYMVWSFKGINGGTIWNIGNGRNNGYPYLDWQYPTDASGLQPSGSGTSGSPYQIATLSNLYWITQTSSSWSSHFVQTADIDASGSSSWDSGAGFCPIGNGTTQFTGSYDGQAYKITHLFINRSTTCWIGLFGECAATITNVKLDNVQITGGDEVGGLIGYQMYPSTASNCCSSGSVTGSGSYVGGLIGCSGSTATNCYSSGSVTGSGWGVGGLIGVQDIFPTATNCYSTDSVTGTGGEVGGLIGCQDHSSTATNCYSSGSVTGSGGHVGGLIGSQEGSSTATNCFWDMQTSGQTSSASGTGKSTAEMKDYLTFSVRGWPFKGINGTVWNIGNGRNNGYPYFDWQYPGDPPVAEASAQPSAGDGSSGNPYQIATLSDLSWITQDAARWNMAYRQTADIDATTSSSLDGGAGFSPIGDGTTQFTGSYDGQAHRITHLFINRSTTDDIGLFGYAYLATIRNVKLDNVHITGDHYVGGLIGFQFVSSTATNCCISGSVTGAGIVGGLIGYQYGSTDSACCSAGSVTGSDYVGGLIGGQCYSSTAMNSYSVDAVTGVDFVGGLIGYQFSSTATNCYSSGSVTGAGIVGGLIGTQENSSTATNCFWDTTGSGQTSSAGGTGESTAEMKTQTTFTDAGWDFTTVWAISSGFNNGYPYLVGVTDYPLAVEATSFAAKADFESVILTWKTQSEVNNAGFNVLRRDPGTPSFRLISSYSSNDSLKGMGTSSIGRAYDFTDNKVTSGATYNYRIQSVSTNGTTNELATLTVTVDVPKTYALYQNYPNPFNPSTTIRFDLKQQSMVVLDIYNVLGERVLEQNYGTMDAGRYNENVNLDAFASGVYFYKISAVGNSAQGGSASGGDGQKFVSTKKLVLMK